MALRSRLLSGSIKRRHGRIVLELARGMRQMSKFRLPVRLLVILRIIIGLAPGST
jgi:hypothetical protein